MAEKHTEDASDDEQDAPRDSLINDDFTSKGKPTSKPPSSEPEPTSSTEPTPPTIQPPSKPNGSVFGYSMKRIYMGAAAVVLIGLCVIGYLSFFAASPADVTGEQQKYSDHTPGEPGSSSAEASVFDRYASETPSQTTMDASVTSSPPSPSSSPFPDEHLDNQRFHPSKAEKGPSPTPIDYTRLTKMLEEIREQQGERFEALRTQLKELRTSVASRSSRVSRLEKHIQSMDSKIRKDNQNIQKRLGVIQKDRSYLEERLDTLSESLSQVRKRHVTEDRRLEQWHLVAIGHNRAVLRGPSGASHSVRTGEQVGTLKILSIQPGKQLVRTNRGTILRR